MPDDEDDDAYVEEYPTTIRETLQADVAAFVASGGAVEQVALGVLGAPRLTYTGKKRKSRTGGMSNRRTLRPTRLRPSHSGARLLFPAPLPPP